MTKFILRTSQMAADTLELLDHFGWNDKVHLVGISMGGMISLELVHAEPTRFQSVTLTSTTSKRNVPTVSVKILTCITQFFFYIN